VPEKPKSLAAIVGVPVSTQLTFGIARVSGIVPVRPSSNAYVNVPLVHESNASEPVPTCTTVVTGGESKLPPVF